MPSILLVKTSSLGDVISNLPVVSDIARAMPGACIDWVVEENFAPVARLHPAIDRVIPVALRRWRKHLLRGATWREIRAFGRLLTARQYDFVIDTQGLLKSAVIVAGARGVKCGYDRASIREAAASAFYHRRFAVSWQWQAVARNRELAALALGYPVDACGVPDYGLKRSFVRPEWLPRGPYCVLLTATSRPEKLWPAEHWIDLGQRLAARGMRCVLPAGSQSERETALAIAARIPDALPAPPLSIDELAQLLAGAGVVVGVDTGLTHLAAAVGVPVVGIYCGSCPQANGVIARRAVSLGAAGQPPSVAAVCEALIPMLP